MEIREKFNVLSKNKDYKSLVSNFSYLTLLQVAGYLFPLITIPYLSRVIGAEGIGRVAFGAAVITWFMSISTWGFNFTATREAARNRDDINKLSEIFSNVFWARSALTLLSFIVLLGLMLIIPSFRANKLVLLITFLTIPANILFPEWLFQALERMKYITILSLISKFLFTLTIFIFVKEPEDYYLDPLMAVTGSFVAGGIALYIIIHKWGIRIVKPSISVIIKTIKGGADVFINNFMPNLYNSMSYVLLGAFSGNASTGLLSAGEKCLNIFQQFMSILARTFFPFLSRRGDKHSIYAKISISVSSLLAIILFVFAPLFIKIFYTEEFTDAILLSRILSISIVFLTINNVYGTNYLILNGGERPLRNITMVCSVLGFVLAVFFIKVWGCYGAAVVIVLVRGITSMSIMSYALRLKRKKNNK